MSITNCVAALGQENIAYGYANRELEALIHRIFGQVYNYDLVMSITNCVAACVWLLIRNAVTTKDYFNGTFTSAILSTIAKIQCTGNVLAQMCTENICFWYSNTRKSADSQSKT